MITGVRGQWYLKDVLFDTFLIDVTFNNGRFHLYIELHDCSAVYGIYRSNLLSIEHPDLVKMLN